MSLTRFTLNTRGANGSQFAELPSNRVHLRNIQSVYTLRKVHVRKFANEAPPKRGSELAGRPAGHEQRARRHPRVGELASFRSLDRAVRQDKRRENPGLAAPDSEGDLEIIAMHPHLLPFLFYLLLGFNLANFAGDLAESRRWLRPKQAFLAVLGGWGVSFAVGSIFLL